MGINRQYMIQLRKICLANPCIIIKGDIVPCLNQYIKLLDDIKFEDNFYHTYYGEIKKIVNSFTTHWAEIIDETIREADRYKTCTKNELLDLMETTINIHQTRQINFGKSFLPVRNEIEKNIYEEIEFRFKEYMQKLYKIREYIVEFENQAQMDTFAKEQLQMTLKNRNVIFSFTYDYISIQLADHIDHIRVSLEEILRRLRHNVQVVKEEHTSDLNCLGHQLYDKNKEQLMIPRLHGRQSVNIAEVQRSIDILKQKIKVAKVAPPVRLTEECEYWESRMQELNQIATTILKLKAEEIKLKEQQDSFKNLKENEIPSPSLTCWDNMDGGINQKLNLLKDTYLIAAKALLTFFSVRGPDRIFYVDDIGRYYLDEYNHRVYYFNNGLNVYHVGCDGKFLNVDENQKYYYDNNGRYFLDNNEKLYQVAPCTSTYKMIDHVLVKHTEDCGHSEMLKEECKRQIRDCSKEMLPLPTTNILNITGTLQPEVSKYLWDSFAHILPDALHDVAVARPRNPIHFLAHKLLYHKYSKTRQEIHTKKVDAQNYRNKIYQERRDEAAAATQTYKSRQVKRRKPEESDDTLDRYVYDTHIAKQEFIRTLNE